MSDENIKLEEGKHKHWCKHGCKHHHRHGGGSCALYGVGVFGAAVYFMQNSHGFWEIILAVLQAFFWPAFVVYKVLEYLQV